MGLEEGRLRAGPIRDKDRETNSGPHLTCPDGVHVALHHGVSVVGYFYRNVVYLYSQ
jgi:hypothetical protein